MTSERFLFFGVFGAHGSYWGKGVGASRGRHQDLASRRLGRMGPPDASDERANGRVVGRSGERTIGRSDRSGECVGLEDRLCGQANRYGWRAEVATRFSRGEGGSFIISHVFRYIYIYIDISIVCSVIRYAVWLELTTELCLCFDMITLRL